MSNKELREAFVAGCEHIRCVYDLSPRVDKFDDGDSAKRCYPPKKVTTPRVVTLPVSQIRYRVRNGVLEFQTGWGWKESISYSGGYAQGYLRVDVTSPPADAAAILDLLQNPTETTEVD